MPELIKLIDVTKTYPAGENTVRALDKISLRVAQGEFVAIVGQSGSGKSTMMNLLGCLDTPSRGDYFLSGQAVSELDDDALSAIRNRDIGFVFQGFNLIPSLNAVENVELPLIYRGIPREKRKKLALEALCRVGLPQRINHLPNQMSGGQQQRVAIARAIAAKPSILLADEPTGNLDSRSGEEVIHILRELWGEGRTIILITHDPQVASHAGRVVRIHDGRIVSDIAQSHNNSIA